MAGELDGWLEGLFSMSRLLSGVSWLAGRLFAQFSGCSALFCDRGRDCLALTGRSVGDILDLSPFSCILVGSLFAGYKVNMITSVCTYLNIRVFL